MMLFLRVDHMHNYEDSLVDMGAGLTPKAVPTGLLTIAVDDGFAHTKVWDGETQQGTFLASVARPGAHITARLLSSQPSIDPGYETDEGEYTVGDGLVGAQTAHFDDYPFSGMNRAIVMHAIREHGLRFPELNLSNRPLKVITGLPLQAYYRHGGEKDKDRVERKRAALLGPLRARDGSALPTIEQHEVMPEGLAAWVDYILDVDGQAKEDVLETAVGVVDVGGRTTDLAVILPGQTIDHARSTSVEVGMAQALGDLQQALLQDKAITALTSRPVITPRHLQKALETGQITMYGQMVNVQSVVEKALETLARRLVTDIQRVLGSASDLESIWFVGGGAKALMNHPLLIKVYPHMRVPDEPSFSNARGFWKFHGSPQS
jgi:plasmid segregation protein ParM